MVLIDELLNSTIHFLLLLFFHGLIHWFSMFFQLLESSFAQHTPLRNTAHAQYNFQHSKSGGNWEEAY